MTEKEVVQAILELGDKWKLIKIQLFSCLEKKKKHSLLPVFI